MKQPHDLQSERALLGAMMVDPSIPVEGLESYAFVDWRNEIVYDAIRSLREKHGIVDEVMVSFDLCTRRRPGAIDTELTEIGGTDYVVGLVESASVEVNP